MSLPLLPGNTFSKTLGQEKFNKVRNRTKHVLFDDDRPKTGDTHST